MVVDHVIDPRGEVILVVRNPNAPFAGWPDNTNSEALVDSETGILAERSEPTELNTAWSLKNSDATVSPQGGVRIRASAKHLTHSSPVFESLLNGNWKEGTELKKQGSIELVVVDWDVDALITVLHIIHAKLSKVPKTQSLEQLAKVALIADYYNIEEVSFFGTMWLDALGLKKPEAYNRDTILRLWVSYYFKNADIFATCSSVAMDESAGPISCLGLPIPGNIIGNMNSRRIDGIERIIKAFRTTRDSFLDGPRNDELTDSTCTLECRAMMYGYITMHMHNLGLFSPELVPPYMGLAYSFFIGIASLPSPQWRDSFHHQRKRRNSSNRYYHSYDEGDHVCPHSTFQQVFRGTYTGTEGLVLSQYTG